MCHIRSITLAGSIPLRRNNVLCRGQIRPVQENDVALLEIIVVQKSLFPIAIRVAVAVRDNVSDDISFELLGAQNSEADNQAGRIGKQAVITAITFARCDNSACCLVRRIVEFLYPWSCTVTSWRSST